MGLDGLSRPDQLIGYMDPLAQMARAEKTTKALQKGDKVTEHDIVDAPSDQGDREGNSPRQWHHGKPKEDSSLEEDLQTMFAEQFNIMLDPLVTYRFFYNDATDKFELLDVDSGRTLLALSLLTFRQATETMRHDDTGMITDRSA